MPTVQYPQAAVKDSGPGYMIVAVSPLQRDDEVWIEYSMQKMTPLFRPLFGTTYARMCTQGMNNPLPQEVDSGDLVLADIHQSGQAGVYLIFVHNTQPIVDGAPIAPSIEYADTEFWSWEPVLRILNIRPVISSGNLVNVIIDSFAVEETKALCDVTVRIWWTATSWPDSQLGDTPITPGWVSQSFANGSRFSKYCLHKAIRVEGASGITAVNGSSVVAGTADTPAIRFPATTPDTWVPQVFHDKIEFLQGRYRRTQMEVDPPFDPYLFPPAPIQESA